MVRWKTYIKRHVNNDAQQEVYAGKRQRHQKLPIRGVYTVMYRCKNKNNCRVVVNYNLSRPRGLAVLLFRRRL